MPTQTDCLIELPLTCNADHDAVLQAVLAEHRGWDVSLRRDGYVVAHQHCNDWHRVGGCAPASTRIVRPSWTRVPVDVRARPH